MSLNQAQASERFSRVDALRGLAMVWMTLFHLSFDLSYMGFWRQNFYADPFWTTQRTLIVSLFLFCAGLGQAIACVQGQSWPRFWRRWRQIALCALLVSAGSWWIFPQSFIYFGVLHGVAVMLLLLRWLAPWAQRHGLALCAIGVVLVASKFAVPTMLEHSSWAELLNQRQWNWLGWITRKPITEDYVPLVPWLGVVVWGFAAGCWALRRYPSALAGSVPGALLPLAWLGRWSLSYYMLHQPVLLGALNLVALLLHP